MNPLDCHRRGSALLIVLGMLSFMLFSGLAFSVYMRQTRLPSSFLRRTTSVRQLAKAALAEAIVDIERVMENRLFRDDRNWDHRVLMYSTNAAVASAETVPTLMLESLAYVPPPLINEVRTYSRKTETAKWHPFDFDAGRFAYTVVDVSDYFDVNRILANRVRGAAASRRVSFAYLFENSAHGELHGEPIAGAAARWDAWLQDEVQARKVDPGTGTISFAGCLPLVSLADFNAAMGIKSFGLLKSPFCAYLDNPRIEGFYPGTDGSADDPLANAYRSMTFVTDSYFPRPPYTDELGKPVRTADLSSAEAQPFDWDYLTVEDIAERGFDQMFLYKGRQKMWDDFYMNFLPRTSMCLLGDYLDVDSVPCSLALPTCERVPMIAAIRPELAPVQFSFVVEKGTEKSKGKEDAQATERTVERTDIYRLNAQQLAFRGTIRAVGVFPFRHVDEEELSSWKIDGQLLCFLSADSQDVPLVVRGLGGRADPLFTSVQSKKSPLTLGPDAWSGKTPVFDPTRGVLSMPFGGGGAFAKLKGDAADDSEAAEEAGVQVNVAGNAFKNFFSEKDGALYFMKVTRQWKQTRKDKDEDWGPADPPEDAEVTKVETRMPLIGADGKTMAADAMAKLLKGKARIKINLAIALRVKDSDNRTVDLVPATFQDDVDQGIVENYTANTIFQTVLPQLDQLGPHLLKLNFAAGEEGAPSAASFSLADFDAAAKLPERRLNLTVVPAAEALMVEDPRFNHNPENWYTVKPNASGNLVSLWYNNHHAADAGRDGDIAMAVSDQGYLQSPYELAFLTRATDAVVEDPRPLVEGGTPRGGCQQGWANYARSNGTRTRLLTAEERGQALDANLMWRTYKPYGRNADNFEDIRITSGTGGFKVNPYSESPEVVMAAFANTPHDWRTCSTNEVMNPDVQVENVEDFNRLHAWNAYSEDPRTRIKWEEFMAVAEQFANTSRTKENWVQAFEELGWETSDVRELAAGVKVENKEVRITSVDRRFFYGFWRECFDASQQLFLVFLRAEPMMMGGGVAATVPPQLGTRAVAVVWRDPTPTPKGEPHRTRILFYHPID